MGFFLPETKTEERLAGPRITVATARQLESLNPTPEQARQIIRLIREGKDVVVQPVLEISVTYPSKLQRLRGANQLYLNKSVSKGLRWV